MSKAIPARVEYNKMGICCIPKFRSDGVKLMAFLESPHQIDTKILKKINAPKCSLTSVIEYLSDSTLMTRSFGYKNADSFSEPFLKSCPITTQRTHVSKLFSI